MGFTVINCRKITRIVYIVVDWGILLGTAGTLNDRYGEGEGIGAG
jgi:hypothetical protein